MAGKSKSSLFDRLKRGLEEGIQYAQGNLTLRTTTFPEEPPEIDAKSLIELRERASMSQAVFAGVLNVSLKTVQSWEQGVRQPSHASRRLLQVFEAKPDLVCKVAGISSDKSTSRPRRKKFSATRK